MAALSLLISYLAVLVDPAVFALPAFFGLAYPYLLLLNIIMVIAWIMLLKYEALISFVIIVAGFSHFSNFIRLSKPSGDRENSFRVISYNIHLFNHFENTHTPAAEARVLATLNSQKPDILCMQEVFFIGDPVKKENSLKKALGGKLYTHMKVLGTGKDRYYGIATFSRYPIISKGEIIHPHSASMTIYSDIVIKNDTLRIYNNHLQSFRLRSMERSFLMQLANDNETMSEVRDISESLKNGFIRRSMQAQVLKDHMANSPYQVIVSGDFNDTPVSYTYRKIRKGLEDSFVNSGYGAGFTYKGKYPPNRIDYILYDKSLENISFEVLKLKYSDHYPIIAWFRKKP